MLPFVGEPQVGRIVLGRVNNPLPEVFPVRERFPLETVILPPL